MRDQICCPSAVRSNMILGNTRTPRAHGGCVAPSDSELLFQLCLIAYESLIILYCTNSLLTLPFMSHPQPTASSSSNHASNFQLIINNALDKYKKRTKHDLLAHPLAVQLQSCNIPSDILSVLQQQVQGLDQALGSDERWSRWLEPTVNVLYTLSSTLAAGVGLVCLQP